MMERRTNVQPTITGQGPMGQQNKKAMCNKSNTFCKMLQILRMFISGGDYTRITTELKQPFPCVETKMKFLLGRVNEIDPSLAARCLSKLKSKCGMQSCRKRPRQQEQQQQQQLEQQPEQQPAVASPTTDVEFSQGPSKRQACAGESVIASPQATTITTTASPDTTAEDAFTRLLCAIRKNNTDLITSVLNHSVTGDNAQQKKLTERTDVQGNTALQVAVEEGDASIVKQLLDSGLFDVNALGARADRRTPLMLASRAGHVQTCKVLLEYGDGVTVDTLDAYKCSALHLAIRYQHHAVLPLLLDNTSMLETSVPDINRLTPLMVAAIADNVTALNVLLERGASQSARTGAGYTSFMLAAKAGSLDTMSRLFDEKTSLKEVCGQGYTALHLAARNGHSQVALKLIEFGFAVDVKTSKVETGVCMLRTPLMMACELGRTETALVLVSMGADVDAEDAKQMTPGKFAAANGHMRTLKALELTAQDSAWV